MCNLLLNSNVNIHKTLNLKFECNRLVERRISSLQTRKSFSEGSGDRVEKIIEPRQLSKNNPKVSLDFLSCQIICE